MLLQVSSPNDDTEWLDFLAISDLFRDEPSEVSSEMDIMVRGTFSTAAASSLPSSYTSFFAARHILLELKDLAIETIELQLPSKYDETENRLGHAQILQLLKLCLRTYFTINGTIYEQVKGTPMGSPISGFIAGAVLQRLESLVFQHHRPKFWARYVDDTFVVIERTCRRESIRCLISHAVDNNADIGRSFISYSYLSVPNCCRESVRTCTPACWPGVPTST
nr:unnamed protein product [Spirometra erinaceieuropaei]